jgi:hypothetical protein
VRAECRWAWGAGDESRNTAHGIRVTRVAAAGDGENVGEGIELVGLVVVLAGIEI